MPFLDPASPTKVEFDAAMETVVSDVQLDALYPFVIQDPATGDLVRLTPATCGVTPAGVPYVDADGPAPGQAAYPTVNAATGLLTFVTTGA